MVKLYLGYDPGGGGAHGVAAIVGGRVHCATVVTAQAAIEWFQEQAQGFAPAALGVDTLTLWSTGPAGWRPADRALRAFYPPVANSVAAPNSLYGSMPINGMLVTLLVDKACGNLKVTETHPKVLYYALTQSVYDYANRGSQMVQELEAWIDLGRCDIKSEHAWDALVSAYAAREWDLGHWMTDLHQLPCADGESLFFPEGPAAHYAWPVDVPQVVAPTARKASGDPGRRRSPEPRARERWRGAVEILEEAGHDDVAQQVAGYQNARKEKSGWDAWLKSNYPALWAIVEQHE
jgi:hypothetical protein